MMILNDAHVYILVSLILSLVILHKKFLIPLISTTDKEIEEIKNNIDGYSKKKLELQIYHDGLLHTLEEENNSLDSEILDANEIAKNIQIDAEKTIENFAEQREKVYQQNIEKASRIAYIELYDAVLNLVMKNSRDSINFNDKEHKSFNDKILTKFEKIRIS